MGGEVSKIWSARHPERSRGTWAGGGAVHRTSTRAPGPSPTLGRTNRLRVGECDVRGCVAPPWAAKSARYGPPVITSVVEGPGRAAVRFIAPPPEPQVPRLRSG